MGFTLGRIPVSALGQKRLGLNFAALTALPVGRQSAVTNAANAAAVTLGVTPQSIIDALAVGRGFSSMLPNDGCLLASSGGAVTVQGDPVGAFRSWAGVDLAVQANASLRPASGASGLVGDGTKWMEGVGQTTSLTNLSFFTLFQQFNVSLTVPVAYRDSTTELLQLVIDGGIRYRDSSGGNTADLISPLTGANGGIVYVQKNGTNLQAQVNNSAMGSVTLATGLIRSTRLTFFALATATTGIFASYQGTLRAFHWSETLMSTAQRQAVREFCRNYYGVVY